MYIRVDAKMYHKLMKKMIKKYLKKAGENLYFPELFLYLTAHCATDAYLPVFAL